MKGQKESMKLGEANEVYFTVNNKVLSKRKCIIFYFFAVCLE
jgi:hypothetical protein